MSGESLSLIRSTKPWQDKFGALAADVAADFDVQVQRWVSDRFMLGLRHCREDSAMILAVENPTQAVQPIVYSGLTKTISLQYLRPDISEVQHFPSSDLGPDLYTTAHREQFLGTFRKVPGNKILLVWPQIAERWSSRKFLGTKFIDVA